MPGNPHPVHIALLVERGIFILEIFNCEELARDRVYEFCFMCLPLSIRGASGRWFGRSRWCDRRASWESASVSPVTAYQDGV